MGWGGAKVGPVMKSFFRYARMLLDYRRLLVAAVVGLTIDTLCAIGGFAALQFIIEAIFQVAGVEGTMDSAAETVAAAPAAEATEQVVTIQQIVSEKLSHEDVTAWIGDQTWIADAMPADPFWGLVSVLAVILTLAVIGSGGRYLHASAVITATLRTILRIRRMIFTRLVHLPLATITKEGTAEQISAVVRDCNVLASGMNAITSRALRGIVQGFAFLLVAIWLDWVIVAIFFVIVPPLAILIRKFGKTIRRATRRAMEHYAIMLGALTEALHGIRVVKVHHTEGYERRRFHTITRKAYMQELRSRTAKALSSPVVEVMSMLGVMIVIAVAAYSVYRGGRTPSELAGVLMFLMMSAMNFRTLAGLNNDLQTSAAAADRIDEVLEQEVEPMARNEHKQRLPAAPRHSRSLQFENITFAYPGNDRPALRDVNLTVPFGSVCAVVGANGSGKTTMLGLIPRLYDPTAGRVLIDGTDIASCTLRSVRSQIAMVTQETVLFEGTVAENLTYGSRHVTEQQMLDATRRAHAHGFITSLEDGYDTEVGERGGRLSGGQRQRIAIARAILRDPSILILDEATSQIDADSESLIAEALAEFMKTRTTLVIAHRLSTVVNADTIVVMSDGMVASVGKHHELLEKSDVYRVLCRTQLQGLDGNQDA